MSLIDIKILCVIALMLYLIYFLFNVGIEHENKEKKERLYTYDDHRTI
jgi:hypothetical protein